MAQAETLPGAMPALERERSVLLLDLSKSMLAPLPDPEGAGRERQKIEVARTAVFRILENAQSSGSLFGLVTFTEHVRVPVPLTEIQRANLPYVENLISLLMPSGRSAIWDALAVGADLLRLGPEGVHGNLVLVTDGWDNASSRFDAEPSGGPAGARTDLVPYLLPPGSQVSLRVIGIGSGSERDKGVDAGRMAGLIDRLSERASELGIPPAFSYQEVTTGTQLFQQMVNAFLDVDIENARPIDQLHPEELATQAASAARALKEPRQHTTVQRLSDPAHRPPTAGGSFAEAAPMEVDVVSTASGSAPPYLRERYGPLGSVIEAYLGQRYEEAEALLGKSGLSLPPVTRAYWEARIRFARGLVVESARALLEAWAEVEKLPVASQPRVARRLALLQARMQNDRETETLVKFIDETDARLARSDPGLRALMAELFARLMELRGTYPLTRFGSEGDTALAAQRHEEAVEHIFGLLQDARLENAGREPAVEGALDFIEICLAEMR